MKKISLLLGLCLLTTKGFSQTLTLEECYSKAVQYSTLSAQQTAHSDILRSNIKSANAAYIPQADINSSATYQSDVMTLPISIPGQEIPSIRKDQYRATLDIQQLIFDGGYTAKQKKVFELSNQVENASLQVKELELKSRVGDVYMAILAVNESAEITKTMLSTINKNCELLHKRKESGVVTQSNIDVLEAEKIKVEQRLTELKYTKNSLLNTLSSITGEEVEPNTHFVIPSFDVNFNEESMRPEYELFDAQQKTLGAKKAVVNTKNIPKAYAFVSGGGGQPGLNMFDNDFKLFAMGGVKLSIPLTKWTSTKHEKSTLSKQQSLIELQKEEYARQNRAQINSVIDEIEKYKELISSDRVLIERRSAIAAAQNERLLGGVATATDYVVELNALTEAELSMKLHEIQMTQAIIKYTNLIGK